MPQIETVKLEEAQAFIRANRRAFPHVAVPTAGQFYGVREEDMLVSILGVAALKSSTRIKAMATLPAHRRRGLSSALLAHAMAGGTRFSAFSTQDSRGLFERAGFTAVIENKHGIAFMTKN